jgi:hypothetical protein
VLAAVVVVALVAGAALVLATRDDKTPIAATASSQSSSSAGNDPVSSDAGALKPGPPADFVEPPTATTASPMVALRHGNHDGFERVAIDFRDPIPPKVKGVQQKDDLGVVRVFLDNPLPTQADGAVRVDVDNGPLVASMYYVVDAGVTWVDVYTKQPADAITFRLASVAFKDGSTRGIVVADIVPADGPTPWGGFPAIDDGGIIGAHVLGTTVHAEGYGVRAAGQGLMRLLDSAGNEARRVNVVLTSSAPVNGVFRTDIDVTGLPAGDYILSFTSDDPADFIDGHPPDTRFPVHIG